MDSRSRSYFTTDSQSVSQSVCLGVGHPFGAHDQILLFPFFPLTFALLLILGRPFWREDRFAICSAICQWSESRRTHNRTFLSYLRLLGSLSVASYDSQGLRLPASTRGSMDTLWQSSFWNTLRYQRKSHWTVTIAGIIRRVLLHYDSWKHCTCPLNKCYIGFQNCKTLFETTCNVSYITAMSGILQCKEKTTKYLLKIACNPSDIQR
jgi:hypothetical protein